MNDLEALRARVAELEARLEIDHAYRLVNGKPQRFEIPAELRKNFPDGIDCRDETIRLLDERIAELMMERIRVRRRAGLREALVLVMNRYIHKGDTRTCLDIADSIRARISEVEKDDG